MRRIACALVLVILAFPSPALLAQEDIESNSSDETAVELLQAYVRLDTVNPPGNEIVGAQFFAEIFDKAGIDYGIAESAPGRANIWARIEGGVRNSTTRDGVERLLFNVEVTQKVPLWLKLVSEDTPGHGSMPRSTSSVTRLVRALENILDHPFPPQIGPAVDAYFKAIARRLDEPLKSTLGNMPQAVQDEAFLADLQEMNPLWHALTRNTCSLTMLEGSNKINVVPPVASAQLDCRLVPEQDPDEFLSELAAIIDDDAIRIERIMGFTPAVSSADTRLFRVIESLTAEYYPDASIVPSVLAGFTDSHFFRDMDILAYGYHPVVLPIEELSRIHGNDERLSLENIRAGTRMVFNVVSEMVYGN